MNFEKEQIEVGKILDRAYQDFNIQVTCLSRPVTICDAQAFYNTCKELGRNEQSEYCKV